MNEIYEVDKDAFTGYKDQLKMSCIRVKNELKEQEVVSSEKFYSIATGALLCEKTFNTDTQEMQYYIYEMPQDSERKAAPRKRIIELQTQEEVQQFFNCLTKVLAGESLEETK